MKQSPSQIDTEVKRLRSTHELWDEASPEWKFFLSAYEGGTAFANKKNLFRHVREAEEDYKDRVKRLHNLNYCEPIVDFFTNFIFSEVIERDAGPTDDREMFKALIADVNRKGDSIDDFMRQVCDDMQIFGMSYVLVDAPALPEGAVLSKQQEQEQGLRPYWVLIKPEEITDWVVDDFGNYLYAKRRIVEDVMDVTGRRRVEVFTEFYTDRYVVSRIDATNNGARPTVISKQEFQNALGRVPLAVVRYKRSKSRSYLGLSFLRDFAYNNREIMNLTSLLQEFLYRQAFNILAKEVDSSIPLQEQQEGVVGTANVMEVPKGAAMPQYISPPADPARFIQDERGRIKNEMFLRASQDAMNELSNGEKSSGFSQAQSFYKTAPFIASRADMLERMEVQLMELTMAMVGKTWSGKIQYKDRYEITNLTDALTQLLVIVNDFKLPSETFVKEELKRVVRAFDGKLPPDELAKILREIDTMDFAEWQDKMGSGKAAASQQKPAPPPTMAQIEAAAQNPKVGATTKRK